jgi:hypothetical protein
MRKEVLAAVKQPAAPAAASGGQRNRSRGKRDGTPSGADGPAGGSAGGAGPSAGHHHGGGGPPVDPVAVEAAVSRLSSSRVSNIFTHLRKVAQHPLLIRARYTDEQVWGGGGKEAGSREQHPLLIRARYTAPRRRQPSHSPSPDRVINLPNQPYKVYMP